MCSTETRIRTNHMHRKVSCFYHKSYPSFSHLDQHHSYVNYVTPPLFRLFHYLCKEEDLVDINSILYTLFLEFSMFEQRTRNILHKHICECQWSLALHVAKKNRELITETFHNGDLPIHMTLKLHGPESFVLFLLERFDL